MLLSTPSPLIHIIKTKNRRATDPIINIYIYILIPYKRDSSDQETGSNRKIDIISKTFGMVNTWIKKLNEKIPQTNKITCVISVTTPHKSDSRTKKVKNI